MVSNALLLSSAEPAYHGRVVSLAMMGFGSQSLLAPVWGLLADRIGVRQTLMVVGIVAASVTLMVALSWLSAEEDYSKSPSVFSVRPSTKGVGVEPA